MKCLPTNNPTTNVPIQEYKPAFTSAFSKNFPVVQTHPPMKDMFTYLSHILELSSECEATAIQPSKAYKQFVKIKNDMLDKTTDVCDKQSIKHWLRRENIELFNWMLNTEEGRGALKYIQKYGRIGVYKAEKLFANESVEKKDIVEKLYKSDPAKAEI